MAQKPVSFQHKRSMSPAVMRSAAAENTLHNENAAIDRPGQWHNARMLEMKKMYPELSTIPKWCCLTFPLTLGIAVVSLYVAWKSRNWSVLGIVLWSQGPGMILYLWRFCLAHEAAHGTALPCGTNLWGQRVCYCIVWLGNPCMVLYSYFRFFHITHHTLLGTSTSQDIANTYSAVDGDMAVGRMRWCYGGLGMVAIRERDPELRANMFHDVSERIAQRFGPLRILVKMSVLWIIFMLSYVWQLVDTPLTACTGLRHIFPNLKASFAIETQINQIFHLAVAAGVCWASSADGSWWKSFLCMTLPDTMALLPPLGLFHWGNFHSTPVEDTVNPGQPTISTYISWLAPLAMNLTYHVEHHDWPTVPWFYLPSVYRTCKDTHYNHLTGQTDLLKLLSADKLKFVYACQQHLLPNAAKSFMCKSVPKRDKLD